MSWFKQKIFEFYSGGKLADVIQNKKITKIIIRIACKYTCVQMWLS
jgi:hypothetical protein